MNTTVVDLIATIVGFFTTARYFENYSAQAWAILHCFQSRFESSHVYHISHIHRTLQQYWSNYLQDILWLHSCFTDNHACLSALQNQMYTTSNYFLCFAFAFRLFSIYSNIPNKKASESDNFRSNKLYNLTKTIYESVDNPSSLQNVIAISLLIHCSNLSIGFAVFSLLSDNNSDMDEFVGFYPQYRIMIEAGFALGNQKTEL